jgi:hypothetical protein
MKIEKDLLEWYYGNSDDYDNVVVSSMPNRQSMQQINIPQTAPSTADMSSVPPESPQREIENREKEQEKPNTADEVAYEDKKKIYRAFGMLRILSDKMNILYSLTNAYQNEPIRREELSQDIKQLTRDLADLVSEV